MEWSQIVQQHGPMVWRTVYRLVNNEADAADCFQRTFMSALELSRRESIGNWRPLLKRIATARALDRLRQRGRNANRQAMLPETDTIDARAVDPGEAAEANEFAEHLRQALVDLDARLGQVFCLACLEGLSYQEIADQIGITTNHVGVLLNRARVSLRKQLETYRPPGSPSAIDRGMNEP
jgi:RNA polymerase sigma-70 factor (ECF subfamily)